MKKASFLFICLAATTVHAIPQPRDIPNLNVDLKLGYGLPTQMDFTYDDLDLRRNTGSYNYGLAAGYTTPSGLTLGFEIVQAPSYQYVFGSQANAPILQFAQASYFKLTHGVATGGYTFKTGSITSYIHAGLGTVKIAFEERPMRRQETVASQARRGQAPSVSSQLLPPGNDLVNLKHSQMKMAVKFGAGISIPFSSQDKGPGLVFGVDALLVPEVEIHLQENAVATDGTRTSTNMPKQHLAFNQVSVFCGLRYTF